jgi:hypothetical protein
MYWMQECGGERLIQQMEKGIIGKIHQMIMMDTKTMEGVLRLLELKKDIQKDAAAIDRIYSAFEEEEKRQEELKQ